MRFLSSLGRFGPLLLAAAVAGSAGHAGAGVERRCSGPGAVSVVIENGVALAPVQLGARSSPHLFLIDTGADATVIDAVAATTLGLERGAPLEIQGGYDVRPGVASKIDLLEIGNLRIESLPVVVHDLSQIAAALDTALHGILGLDVLSRSPFALDYQGRCAQLPAEPLRADVSSLPLERVDRGHLVTVLINGSERAQLLLDTGSSMSHLHWAVWERLAARAPHAPKLVSGFVSATQTNARSYLTRLASIRMGEFLVREPVIRVLQVRGDGAFAEPGAGVLGGDVLEGYRVRFDLANGRLQLDPSPSYRPDPLRFTTVGVQVLRRSGAFVIAAVWEGGPAARAGVDVGDEILEIDGSSVAGWSGSRVVDALRGAGGTTVTVRLRRGDAVTVRTLHRERLL